MDDAAGETEGVAVPAGDERQLVGMLSAVTFEIQRHNGWGGRATSTGRANWSGRCARRAAIERNERQDDHRQNKNAHHAAVAGKSRAVESGAEVVRPRNKSATVCRDPFVQ